ncbi:VanZ family protein [Polaribacter sp.]|uniref:VanZ family protein n=1 Tax=Polaribacter sp. TaxID=1920175 RepID=UPI00260D11BE|nr:VanZ family protein [uncultured Polaribacter sp.]
MKDKIFIIAILVSISILYLSLIKMPKYDVEFNHLDKWQHTFAYFTLAICWLFALYKKTNKYFIVFGCIIFGIIIEILQSTVTNYRTGDSLDVVANSIGVLIGLLFFNQISKKNLLN